MSATTKKILMRFSLIHLYTLLVFNSSSFVAVQGVRPNHYVHSNLSSGTTYYFALELSGDFPKSPIHSLTVNISTMIDCVGKPVRCQNGKCAMSVLECAVNKTICSPDKPYLCFNGDCKESYKSCRSKTLLPCASYTCWNGHCVANASLCDPLPSCPVLTRRCRDATCALTNETCDDSACNTLCPDGSCSPCHTTYGCPLAVPILCPNGSCVANETSCREGCNNTTYRCYDGSCLEDYTLCPTAPRLNHPIPFSYVFSAPKPKRTTNNISIPIFSDSLLSIASIEVPPSLLASPVLSPGDASPYSLAVEPVADSNLYNVGFGVWDNTTFGAALMSSVLSLSINGLTQFPDPVKITFLNELPPDENISTLCLAFINRTTQQWQRVGGVQVVNGTIIGYTSHFTEFAVMYGVKPPPVNTISRDDFEKLRHVNKNTVGIWVVSGVLAVYLAALFFTFRNDKKRAIRNSIHMSLSSPLDSPASVQLSTFSIDSSDPIVDSTPSSSVPATPEMTSSPRSPEMSNYNDTLAKSLIFKKDTDGKLKDGSGNVIGLKDLFVRRFPEKHSWLAVYFRPTKRAQLTHTDLLTLLFCMVWANLMVSSLLFTPSDPYAFGQKIVNGICVACIVFPITLIFSIMFQRMPRRYKWVTYTLAITFYLVCAILTLVETLRFGDSETKTFLVSITVSTVQDGLINQPIKLVLTCLIIILHPAAPLVAMLL